MTIKDELPTIDRERATDQRVLPLCWRLRDITRETGMRRSSIYAAMKALGFPAPAKVGRASLWSRASVIEWLDARFAERGAAH
ncbi:helix-turn-helix transcriptional regulator [Dokdonella sp.]|uniref:helix-turn-helix transcriptional regulator n=1 Tax=Dokdonella sp. TaxID=2291710 RepID=UPI003782E5EC